MSVQVSYSKQSIFLFLFLVVFLLFLEILVNIWWEQELIANCLDNDSAALQDLDENVQLDLCRELYDLQYTDNRIFATHGSDININSEGFRGPEFQAEKPDDVYRIFAVGGSTTFGSRVLDDQTWSAYLQEKFHDVGLNSVEVINAGILAATSEDETNLIKNRIFGYSPDMLIVYDGWNDLYRFNDPVSWKENWREICELGNETGFDTIITLQPFVGTGNRVLTSQETHYLEENLQRLSSYHNYADQLMELDSFCTKTYDMRAIFDDKHEPIYYDRAHTGPRGYFFIAEKMFDVSYPIVSQYDKNDNSEFIDSSLIKKLNKNKLENPLREVFSIYKTPRAISYFLSGFDQQVFTFFDFNNEKLNESFIDKDFSNLSLIGFDFSNYDLSGTNFYRTNLASSNLSYLDLTQTLLKESILTKADLTGSDLSGMDLSKTDLSEAILEGANLTNTKLDGTIFVGTILSNAQLQGTDLKGQDFSGAVLTNIDFSGLDLSRSKFHGADLSDSNFTNSNLSNSTFSYKKTSKIPQSCADLLYYGKNVFDKEKNVISYPFCQKILLSANMSNAIFVNTDFSGSYVQEVDFSKSRIINVTESTITQPLSTITQPISDSDQ